MITLATFFPWIGRSEPAFDAVPDMTGAGWGMEHLIDMLNENTEVPKTGDIVARLESCGMGVSVRRDTRYRVTGPGPYRNSVTAVTEDGSSAILYAWYMRKHQMVPRFWMDFD